MTTISPTIADSTRRTGPTFSVIVCAYSMERLDQVRRCVASVLGGVDVPEELFVVIDGNPLLRDRLIELLPEQVDVVDNEGKGLADGRTTGLRRAKGDVAAFIDDDAWADPIWLAELREAFRDPDVIGAGGKVVPEWEDPYRALPPEIYWVVGSTYLGHRVDAGPISRPIGANMAVRRATLLGLGGFPAAFGRQEGITLRSNEELAAFTTITNRYGDACVQFVPTAKVHHFAPTQRCSVRYVMRRSKAEGISKADVRRLFGSGTMGTDRTYGSRKVIPIGVLRYLVASVRRHNLDALRSAMLVTVAFGTTCGAYVLRLQSSWLSAFVGQGRDHRGELQ